MLRRYIKVSNLGTANIKHKHIHLNIYTYMQGQKPVNIAAKNIAHSNFTSGYVWDKAHIIHDSGKEKEIR